MSDTLVMTVTDAGRAALVNAQNNGTAPVLVAHIGVTDQAFTATASMTALPGELKQLSTFSGAVTASDTIHVIIRDDGSDTYTLRGFGLYLDDGTLLASYGQADVIMEKSAQAMLLLATDTIFASIDATDLSFGDTNFLNPAATTERQGVVELATATEATAGTDATRAMTPATHRAAMDNRLGQGAPSTFVKSLLTKATAALFCAALNIKSAATFDAGAGNGLDADKLDGQHGAYYLDWGNFQNVPTSFPTSAHTHKAGDITSGTFPAARGGTGRSTLTAGSYLVGAGTDAVVLKTPAQVRTDIGAASASHSHAMGDINGLANALGELMPKTWRLTAGAGLSGGGTGSSNRTVSLGIPSTITGASGNSASGDSHTHKLDTGTGADQIPRNKDLGTAAKRDEGYFAKAKHTHELGDIEHFTQGSDWARWNQLPDTDTEGWSLRFASHAGDDTVYWRYNDVTKFIMYPDGTVKFYGTLTVAGTKSYGDTVVDPDSTYERVRLNPRSSLVGNDTNTGFYDPSAGAYMFRIALDGYNCYAYGTVNAPGFSSSASSRTVKHDIAPCRYGLDEALRLPWLEYRYDASITPDARLRFGSAVEAGDGMEGVEDVTPLLVIRRPGDVPTLEYDQFIPVLGRALQQYVQRTDAHLQRLDAAMQKMAARLEALETRA